jgi:hypothetical protein
MPLTIEDIYLQLGRSVSGMPDLEQTHATPETKTWLERVGALVQMTGGLADSIQFKVAAQNLDGALRARHARNIAAILQRALAKAELEVAPESRGAFITATNAFDIFAAVRRVLSTAQAVVLLVDVSADATVLTDYAVLAPEHLPVRLLTGETEHDTTLIAAAESWKRRFADARPLMIRQADAGALRDRLILLDGVTVWTMEASFSDLASTRRTTLMRMAPDAATAKVAAYSAIWETARPL